MFRLFEVLDINRIKFYDRYLKKKKAPMKLNFISAF